MMSNVSDYDVNQQGANPLAYTVAVPFYDINENVQYKDSGIVPAHYEIMKS